MFDRLRSRLRRTSAAVPTALEIAAGASFDQAVADARCRQRWDPGLPAFTALMTAAGFADPSPPDYAPKPDQPR